MNKREIEATVRNLPHWLPCPIMFYGVQACVLVHAAGGWFDCPERVIQIIPEYTRWEGVPGYYLMPPYHRDYMSRHPGG